MNVTQVFLALVIGMLTLAVTYTLGFQAGEESLSSPGRGTVGPPAPDLIEDLEDGMLRIHDDNCVLWANYGDDREVGLVPSSDLHATVAIYAGTPILKRPYKIYPTVQAGERIFVPRDHTMMVLGRKRMPYEQDEFDPKSSSSGLKRGAPQR
ncbi:MAG: hypothetical protein R3C19_22125 [Planctomycetaceae bacterium]